MKEKIRAAGKRLSVYFDGPYRHALQTLDFEFLGKLFMHGMFDDDDFEDDYDDYYEDDDDYYDDDIDPFEMVADIFPDIKDFKDPIVSKTFSDMAKDMKREDPKAYQQMFERLFMDIENIIEIEGLRGASSTKLKKFKKMFKKDNQAMVPIAMLNLLFPKEARKHLSQEAKAVFLY